MRKVDVANADVIRGVLDGGRLQFKRGRGKWIDAGGDAQAWMTLLTLHDTRGGTYRIAPGSIPCGVTVGDGQTKPPSGTVDPASQGMKE